MISLYAHECVENNVRIGEHYLRIVHDSGTLDIMETCHDEPWESFHLKKNVEQSIQENCVVASETTANYHGNKKQIYIKMLKTLLSYQEAIESGFFIDFQNIKKTNSEIDPLILQTFKEIITDLSKENLECEYYNDDAVIRKLPIRLLCDFVLCSIRDQSVEAEVLRLSNKKKCIALDPELNVEYFEEEKILYESPLDLSFLKSSEERAALQNACGEVAFFQDPRKWADHVGYQQLKKMCWYSKEDCQSVLNSVLTETIMKMNCAKKEGRQFTKEEEMRIRKKNTMLTLSLVFYGQGLWSSKSSQEKNTAERNYKWIKGPLLELMKGDAFCMYGSAHSFGEKPHRGLLQFFMDIHLKQNREFWKEHLTEEILNQWESINIKSIQRLQKGGNFLDFIK
jgi:hypothetical protein